MVKDASIGFVEGYLSTLAFEGVAGLVGEGLFGSMFAGGAGAFTQAGLDQLLTTGHLDVRRLAFDTAIGAGTAGLFHGAGKAVSAAREFRATRAMQRSLAEEAPILTESSARFAVSSEGVATDLGPTLLDETATRAAYHEITDPIPALDATLKSQGVSLQSIAPRDSLEMISLSS